MKILTSIIIVLSLATPAQAIGGFVEVSYDINGTGQGVIELHQELNDNIKVGIKGESDLAGFGSRMGLPTGIPLNQSYEGFVEVSIDSFDVRLTTWCKHWFSQSGRSSWADEEGIRITGRYNF